VDFLNANLYRSYPFLAGATAEGLFSNLIVDLQCEIYPEAGFTPETDFVYLYNFWVRPDAEDPIYIELRMSHVDYSTELHSYVYFNFLKTDKDFTTRYAEAPNKTWRAWLTIGDVSEVPINHNDLHHIATKSRFRVEPSRVRVRNGNRISSWNIANMPRIRATAPSACEGEPAEPRTTQIYRGNIASDFIVQAGYNASVSLGPDTQTLVVGGLVGGGKGEPCQEIPVTSSEVPPEEGGPLTGGPWCSDTIKSILGSEGPLIRFVAGDGITISPDANDQNMLRIAADLRNLLGPTRFLEVSSSL
jgi:hypothetical protein